MTLNYNRKENRQMSLYVLVTWSSSYPKKQINHFAFYHLNGFVSTIVSNWIIWGKDLSNVQVDTSNNFL